MIDTKYTMSFVSITPLPKLSRWSPSDTYWSTVRIAPPAKSAPHPITHSPRRRPNVANPATIWFSVSEEKNTPMESSAHPRRSRPR